MSGLKYAESFRDLLMYQKARELQQEVFMVSGAFPKEEKFSLSDQIRRSSRSIGANLAEAWGKRRYEAHFVSKLTDADGEQYETQHWIETAVECGYLDQQKGTELLDRCKQIGRLLGGTMEKAHIFCGALTKAVRESTREYLVNSTGNPD
ncbi:MAG: four helix bundle protein [Chloroflexi bacterium]|nr:four helix bundle protein [Chloroflexota bacterium]